MKTYQELQMRPYPEEVLRALQTGVGSHLAPEVKSSYGQAQFAFAMLLFGVVQRDYDSAAQDLIDANATLRDILVGARDAIATLDRDDARDIARALDALPPAATSARLSSLRSEHDALREAVIRLVPLVEPAADDPALAAMRPTRSALWDCLRADAQRRVVPILTN
jgi:hypothetical protein